MPRSGETSRPPRTPPRRSTATIRAQKLYRELKGEAGRIARPRPGPVIHIGEGLVLKFTPARGKKQPAVAMEDSRVPQLRAKLGISEIPTTRITTRRSPRPCENSRRAPSSSPPACSTTDRQGHQQPEARPPDRHRDRQHGALALAAAPARRSSIGNAYVILNIPDYTLKVMQHGAQVWTTKVVTGKPGDACDAASDGDDEVHHRQSDLERAAVDHLQRISAGAAAGSDRAGAHGAEARARPRRQHPYFAAARRGQRARPHPLQLPEQVPGLSARYAGQEFVRQGRARLQPRLHAGAESGSIRVDPAQHHDAERALHAGENPRACTATARST